MKLAVIILNWNGLEMLRRFLPSVIETTSAPDIEVIVADNGSSDDSVKWLKKEYPRLPLIEFRENFGFAGGYDRAIRLTGAEYTLLLNSDVETPQGWWQPLLEYMESNPRAGAIQPKILSFRNKDLFEHAGAAGGLLDRLGYPYARGRVFDKVQADKGQWDTQIPIQVAWTSGAAMLIRTQAYVEAGGLDEKFFAHMEEIDLCWRMRLAGYGIYASSSSKVYHYGGGALAYGNPRKTYLNFRNNLLMLHKNLPRRKGKKLVFIRRIVDSLGFGLFVAKGEWSHAKALLKAHRDFKKMQKDYTSFPDRDILPEIPGTDRYIYLDYVLSKLGYAKKEI